MKIFVNNFKGHAPKIPVRNLPNNFAAYAENTDVSTGDIKMYQHEGLSVTLPSSSYGSFFKWNFKGRDFWYTSSSDHVSAIEVPLLDSSGKRAHLYYLDDGGTLKVCEGNDLTSGVMSISGAPKAGMDAPSAPRMTVQGNATSENTKTYSYVVCFARSWADAVADLGPASPPALDTVTGKNTITIKEGQTVMLTGIKGAEATGWTGLNSMFIFRSTVSSWGGSTYQLIANPIISTSNNRPGGISPGTAFSFHDTGANPQSITLPEYSNTQLPKGASGFISLNNGVYCAYKNSTVYVSGFNRPYAFPQEYTVTINEEIVGLGSYGNTVVALTKSNPVLITVADPANPIVKPMQDPLPCLSKRSIVSTSRGVMYASDKGIVCLSSSAPQNVTAQIYDVKTWAEMNPNEMICAFFGNALYIFNSTRTSFEVMSFDEYSYNSLYGTLSSSGTITRQANLTGGCKAIFWYPYTQTLYVASNSSPTNGRSFYSTPTHKFDSGLKWTSKTFVSNQGEWCPAVMKVNIDSGTATAVVRLDGTELCRLTVNNDKPFKLPAGRKGTEVDFDILSSSGSVSIHSVTIASSMVELLEVAEA